jgi:hypothetical protein
MDVHYYLRTEAVTRRWARLLTERSWTEQEMLEHRARLQRMDGAAKRQLLADEHERVHDRLIEAARPVFLDPEGVPDRIREMLEGGTPEGLVRTRIAERPSWFGTLHPQHTNENLPATTRFDRLPEFESLRQAGHAWLDVVQGRPVPLPSFIPLHGAAHTLTATAQPPPGVRSTPSIEARNGPDRTDRGHGI